VRHPRLPPRSHRHHRSPTPSEEDSKAEEEQVPPAKVFYEADFIDNDEDEAAALEKLHHISAR
jgi:hypothetical protein